jgi:predicted dehydrogenase
MSLDQPAEVADPLRVAMIGCGRMARYHIRLILQQLDTTRITVLAVPDPEHYAAAAALFDTGAHMLNTCADLAGEDFVEVAAWLDNCSRPVDTRGTVMARLAPGAFVTMHAFGEAIPSCASDVRV